MSDFKNLFPNLETFINKHGYTIGKLVSNDGNCLFESLEFLEYGEAYTLRKAFSVIMYEFREYVGLFEDYKDKSLKQLYSLWIDEQLPLVVHEGKIVKYTFEVLCHDLSRSKSWKRIHPIELLFLTISKFLNVEIVIYTDFESIINYKSDNSKKYPEKIVLGYINQNHYVPLIKITQNVLL